MVADVPMPAAVLGFAPGDDRKLASWSQVVEYFEQLDRTSDRLAFETLGQTSMGKPFVMATISAPENLARLGEYKDIQAQLADPRKLGALATRDRKAAELIKRGKSIVLITCGIHSTEVGSYLSSMLIAHRLASSNEPEIQNILANSIVLLVPSLNPDGVDIVKNWYDKTLGTPYEGTDPPELYHKYTGHDNNRDWYAFTQVETQLTVDKIHNVWHPQIVHDIHQQGAMGARLFLPPYMAPVEPNVPKPIIDGYTKLGTWMARELRAQGFEGITTNSTYDAWTPARAYSHYHAGVRMLSETASAKIASPMTLKLTELTSRDGYDPQKESVTFGPLWRGGEWKLRDITKYMTTAAFLLMRNAAENRVEWLQRFYTIGKDAVRPRRPGELFGFLIEPSKNSEELTQILVRGGVWLDEPKEGTTFKSGALTFPEGTKLVRMDQPYGGFAKALLEVQPSHTSVRRNCAHPSIVDGRRGSSGSRSFQVHTSNRRANRSSRRARCDGRVARHSVACGLPFIRPESRRGLDQVDLRHKGLPLRGNHRQTVTCRNHGLQTFRGRDDKVPRDPHPRSACTNLTRRLSRGNNAARSFWWNR
jgi:hypothetical protein